VQGKVKLIYVYNPNLCPITEAGRRHGKKQYDKKWQNTIKNLEKGGQLAAQKSTSHFIKHQ